MLAQILEKWRPSALAYLDCMAKIPVHSGGGGSRQYRFARTSITVAAMSPGRLCAASSKRRLVYAGGIEELYSDSARLTENLVDLGRQGPPLHGDAIDAAARDPLA